MSLPSMKTFLDKLEPLGCAICHEAFGGDHVPVQIPSCDHHFGMECLRTWFSSNLRPNTCSMCRKILFKKPAELNGEEERVDLPDENEEQDGTENVGEDDNDGDSLLTLDGEDTASATDDRTAPPPPTAPTGPQTQPIHENDDETGSLTTHDGEDTASATDDRTAAPSSVAPNLTPQIPTRLVDREQDIKDYVQWLWSKVREATWDLASSAERAHFLPVYGTVPQTALGYIIASRADWINQICSMREMLRLARRMMEREWEAEVFVQVPDLRSFREQLRVEVNRRLNGDVYEH